MEPSSLHKFTPTHPNSPTQTTTLFSVIREIKLQGKHGHCQIIRFCQHLWQRWHFFKEVEGIGFRSLSVCLWRVLVLLCAFLRQWPEKIILAVASTTDASNDPVSVDMKLFSWLILKLNGKFNQCTEHHPFHVLRKRAKWYGEWKQ